MYVFNSDMSFCRYPLPLHSLSHLFILLALHQYSYILWYIFWNGIRWEATLLVFFLHILSLILLLWAGKNLHMGTLLLPFLHLLRGCVGHLSTFDLEGGKRQIAQIYFLYFMMFFPQGVRTFPRNNDKRQKIGALWVESLVLASFKVCSRSPSDSVVTRTCVTTHLSYSFPDQQIYFQLPNAIWVDEDLLKDLGEFCKTWNWAGLGSGFCPVVFSTGEF